MKYKVTVVSGNSYDVKVSTKREISSIEVNTTPRLSSLGEIEDIDTSNLQNNGILIYNSSTQKYEFVDPAEILDRADGVDDGSLDYGNY
jgi:hypothetical protein